MDELQSWVSHILPSLSEQNTGKTEDTTDDPIDDSWELIDFVDETDTKQQQDECQSSGDNKQSAEEQDDSATTSQQDAKKGSNVGGILKQTKVDSLVQEDFDVVSIQKNLKVSFEIPDLVNQTQSSDNDNEQSEQIVDSDYAKTLESNKTQDVNVNVDDNDADEQSEGKKREQSCDHIEVVGKDAVAGVKVARNEKKKKKRKNKGANSSVIQTQISPIVETQVEQKSAKSKKETKKTDNDTKSQPEHSSIRFPRSDFDTTYSTPKVKKCGRHIYPSKQKFSEKDSIQAVESFPKIAEQTPRAIDESVNNNVKPANSLSYAAVLASKKEDNNDDAKDEQRESPSGAVKRNRPVSTSSLSGDEFDLLSYPRMRFSNGLGARIPNDDDDDDDDTESIASSDFSDFDCGIQAVNDYIMRPKRGHKKRTRSQSSLSEVLVQLKSRVCKKDSSKVSDKEACKPVSNETKKGSQIAAESYVKYGKPINKKLARSASNPSVSQAAIVQIRGKNSNVDATVPNKRVVKGTISMGQPAKLATIETGLVGQQEQQQQQQLGGLSSVEADNASLCSASAAGNDSSDFPEMDESWYVTPPPCFTGSKNVANHQQEPEVAKEAARENALIEHPSIYVSRTTTKGVAKEKAYNQAARKVLGDSNCSNSKAAKKAIGLKSAGQIQTKEQDNLKQHQQQQSTGETRVAFKGFVKNSFLGGQSGATTTTKLHRLPISKIVLGGQSVGSGNGKAAKKARNKRKR